LGRSLDELPPQTRVLLKHIHRMVTQQCKAQGIEQSHSRFSRKDVRNFIGWGNTQLKVHLKRLEDMEHLLVHRGGRGQSFVYELLYRGEGKQGERFASGLIDIQNLDNLDNRMYDEKKSGVNDHLSGSSRPQVGEKSGSCRPEEKPANQGITRVHPEFDKKEQKNVYRHKNPNSSHRTDSLPLAAAK
jgi:hypothetical protein